MEEALLHLWRHLDDVLTGSVIALVFSAAARALPEPLVDGGRFYLFFYRFVQNMLANFDKTSKTEDK